MAPIDWTILIVYLAATLALGLWLARRNRGEDDYFVAGRRLSGWLAGASMAATTFRSTPPFTLRGSWAHEASLRTGSGGVSGWRMSRWPWCSHRCGDAAVC